MGMIQQTGNLVPEMLLCHRHFDNPKPVVLLLPFELGTRGCSL